MSSRHQAKPSVMDISSAVLSQTRVNVSCPVFSALGSSGGSWSFPGSDTWSNPPGDPWSYTTSDPEFSNMSSPETVSPSSSSSYSSIMDFSPPGSASSSATHSVHAGLRKRSSPSPPSSSTCEDSGCPSGGGGGSSRRRLRVKNPSRQRQSASEKEKLRMRDLTKELNHLRTYLPPSVVPVGQTLTKIQTLTLAIRYIAHLSTQLGPGEEVPRSRGEQVSLSVPRLCCPGQEGERFTGQCWGTLTHPCGRTEAKQELWQRNMELPTIHEPQNATYDSTYEDLFNSSIDSLLQSPLHTTEARQSYQEYGKDVTFHSITPEYWI